MKQLKAVIASTIPAVVCASALTAIDISGFDPGFNDRFSGSGSFVAEGYDLSGVALADDGRWLTMISDNVFLSSNHFFPSNGTSVTFYAGNNGVGPSAVRSVATSQRIGTSELRIGVLDESLGADFSFYDFATEGITSTKNGGSGTLNASGYKGENAFVFGRSASSRVTSQDMAVGRNTVDRWFGGIVSGGTIDRALGTVVNSADAKGKAKRNYLDFEAQLRTGDSGAPLLVDNGSGALTIVGTNWFTATLDGEEVNGFAYVGNYATEISEYLSGYGTTSSTSIVNDGFQAVPEPSVYALVCAFSALLLLFPRSASKGRDRRR